MKKTDKGDKNTPTPPPLEQMARQLEAEYQKIEAAKRESDPGLTDRELAEYWDVSLTKAKAKVRELIDADKAIVGKRWFKNRDGNWSSCRAIRPKEKGGEI